MPITPVTSILSTPGAEVGDGVVSSAERNTNRSCPAPPVSVSLPAPPSSLSSPSMPNRMSLPVAAADIVVEIAADQLVIAVAAIDHAEVRHVGQAAEVEDVAGPGADHASTVAMPGLDRGRMASNLASVTLAVPVTSMVSVPVAATHDVVGGIGSGDDEGIVASPAIERVDAGAAGDAGRRRPCHR